MRQRTGINYRRNLSSAPFYHTSGGVMSFWDFKKSETVHLIYILENIFYGSLITILEHPIS